MKKILLFLFLLSPMALMAQTGVDTGEIVIDFTTFTGIMAVVTALVTQVAKLVPAIGDNKWFKVLTSLGVGIVVCFFAWGLQLSPLLEGLVWWQTLVYGLAVGLSAAGFYDLVKVLWNLFGNKEEKVEG